MSQRPIARNNLAGIVVSDGLEFPGCPNPFEIANMQASFSQHAVYANALCLKMKMVMHGEVQVFGLRSDNHRMNLSPVTLSGRHIRLEPLQVHHIPELTRAGLFPELWRWQPAPMASEADMQQYVHMALQEQKTGSGSPFVITDNRSNQIIGSTRFMDIALQHFRLEIGATWLTPQFQRGPANTEAKSLLLGHAFGTLGVKRVVFKTETLNEPSRQPLLRIGAVEEGTFRQHLYTTTGRARGMVYFSILASEWPQVKSGLTSRLLQD